MLRRAVVVLCALAACKSKPTTGSPELDEFEQVGDSTPFDGAYVSKSGVFLHRKLAVPPDQLATPGALRAALAANPPPPELVVFDIDDKPAAIACTLLRDLSGTEVHIARRDPERPSHWRDGLSDTCTLALSTKPIANPKGAISIDIQPDVVFSGLSPTNEFYEIRKRGDAVDWEKLEMTLKEHKASALFAERTDVELAIDDKYKSETLLRAALVACNVGFYQVAIVPRDELTAKTTQIEAVDLAGLATAADVIGKLRAYEGKDGIRLRVGNDTVCDFITIVASKKHPRKPPVGSGYFVARVHRDGSAWIAMSQTFDPKDPTTEFKTRQKEVEAGALPGELNNMRLFTNIEHVPLELAADSTVDAKPFIAAIAAACYGRIEELDLRTPNEQSLQPGQP